MKIMRQLFLLALIAAMLSSNCLVFAESASPLETLTIKDAAKKAIENDTNIKNAEESLELYDDKMKKATDTYLSATTTDAILNASINMMNLDLSRALSIKNIDSQKENVEYNIQKYFNTIINAEKSAELYEESLAIQKKKLDISKVKLELGKISQNDYDKEAAAYEQSLMSKEAYLSTINKAYRDLNSYMGKPLDTTYELVLELEYEVVPEVNLTAYTDTFVNKSLSVQQAKDSMTVAEYQLDNYTEPYNTVTGLVSESYGEYEQLLSSFNQASRSYSDTVEKVKKSVIDSYNSLREAEVTIKSKEMELEEAYKQLEILKTKLELGKITQIEYDEQAYDIKNKEENLRKEKNNYALSAIAFLSPNLLVS